MAAHRLTTFTGIGSEGEPYPEWLRMLRKIRGCYVIRDKASKRVVYVGSSKSTLYGTITRHFQQWKRNQRWWSGAYGAGHDPGMTYPRGRSEVAVLVMEHGGDHLKAETGLIARYKPRDNLVEKPDGCDDCDAPF